MRFIVLAFALAAAPIMLETAPAKAEILYPWCLQTNNGDGAMNCAFDSEAQCRQSTVSGGGFCMKNTAYTPPPPEPPPYQPPPAPAPKTSHPKH